jgi:4-hydroxybenzoate polyprenyltransferase
LFLIEHWLWLGVTAFLTFLYSAPKIEHPLFISLRRIAIGKTIFLAFAWTHVTVILPLLITATEFEASQAWFVVNRFFFLYAICIVFDRRDLESDRAAGIKSLVTFFSPSGVDRLFWFSIVVAAITSIVLIRSFTLGDVVILLVPVCLMGLLYNYSKRSTSDYLYYFLLDGLMALSAAILILANFAR